MDTAPISSVVFERAFDPEVLEQIGALRTIRLNMAEKMLKEIEATSSQLTDRGLVAGSCNFMELRKELTERVTTLRNRMGRPDVVFQDEISLFVELVEQSEILDEANGQLDA